MVFVFAQTTLQQRLLDDARVKSHRRTAVFLVNGGRVFEAAAWRRDAGAAAQPQHVASSTGS